MLDILSDEARQAYFADRENLLELAEQRRILFEDSLVAGRTALSRLCNANTPFVMSPVGRGTVAGYRFEDGAQGLGYYRIRLEPFIGEVHSASSNHRQTGGLSQLAFC